MHYPLKISNYDRLFTFGCSFTNYWWPTWADILGLSFKEHQNWGQQGAGNQFIAESISECDIWHNLNSKDLVFISFSSYPRYDYYKDGSWRGRGNILTDRKMEPVFIEKYYSDKGYILKTLNMINLSLSYLKRKKIDYIITTMKDLTTMYGRKPENQIITDIYPEFTKHYEEIFIKENFVPPIYQFIQKNYVNSDYYKDSESKIDLHPTPKMHYQWLIDEVSEKFILFTDEEKSIMMDMAYKENDKLMKMGSKYIYHLKERTLVNRI